MSDNIYYCQKMTLSLANNFPLDGMWILYSISTWRVDWLANYCHFTFLSKSHAKQWHDRLWKSYSYVFKDKCSSSLSLTDTDSWFFNESLFTKSSTHHDCFSLPHFNIIFFCLSVNTVFPLFYPWFKLHFFIFFSIYPFTNQIAFSRLSRYFSVFAAKLKSFPFFFF